MNASSPALLPSRNDLLVSVSPISTFFALAAAMDALRLILEGKIVSTLLSSIGTGKETLAISELGAELS